MSLEGTSQPQYFLIEPSRQANSIIIETIDQKTSVPTQKNVKPTLHSLGRFLGKSLNFRELKTFTIGRNQRRSRHFPFLKPTHSVIPYVLGLRATNLQKWTLLSPFCIRITCSASFAFCLSLVFYLLYLPRYCNQRRNKFPPPPRQNRR